MLLKHPNADDGDEAPLVLGSHEQEVATRRSTLASRLFFLMLFLVSILWLAAVVVYADRNIGWANVLQMLPHEIGAFSAGAFAPLAFLWLLGAYARRGVDNRLQGASLDALLRELSYPSPEAEARVASLTMTLRRHAREIQAETENAATRLRDVNQQLTDQQSAARQVTEKLLGDSDQLQGELDARIAVINELLEKSAEQTGLLDEIALEQDGKLKEAYALADDRTASIEASLGRQIEALEAAVAQSEAKAQSMTDLLSETSQGLEAAAARMLEKATSVTGELGSQIRSIDNTSDMAREKIDRGSDQFKQRIEELEDLSRRSRSELENASDELRERTSDLGQSSQVGSQKLLDLRDQMIAGVTQVEAAIETLQARQAEFRSEADGVARDLGHNSGMMSDEARKMASMSTELGDEVRGAMEGLQAEMQQMQEMFKSTQSNLGDVEAILQKGEALLQEAGARSLANADDLKARLRDYAAELDGNTSRAATRTTEIQDQFKKQILALQDASAQIDELSQDMSARLDGNVDNLSRASLEANNQITQLGSGFQRQAEALNMAASRMREELKEAGEGLKRETHDIEQSGTRTSRSLRDAVSELEQKQKDLATSADLSSSKLSMAIEEAVRHHQDLMASAERATLQARQSGENAQSQSAELARIAEKASAELRALGDQAQQYVEGLEEAASRARAEGASLSDETHANVTRIEDASKSAKEQFEDLTALSENARNNAQSMEKVLREETSAMTEVARDLAEKSEYIEKSLSERTRLLEKTRGLSNVAGDAYRRKTLELAKASELMLSGLQTADEALNRHRRQIENTRARFQVDLDSLTSQMNEAGERADHLSDHTAKTFKSRAEQLAAYVGNVQAGSSRLLEQFEQQKKRLEVTAHQVENSLKQTSSLLQEESRNLKDVSTSASEEALISSLKFQKQAERLKEASARVQQQSEEISARQKSSGGEAFRKASALIIDSIHSISIDLARSLDNTLPDELWNRYRKGEKSIFTKKLLRTRDQDKIKTLYKESGDFRRYVDQYRRSFRQLLEETEQSEHAKMLFETYSSSDIGKVYFMLNDALGDE